jgi:hypothetical protein
MMGAELGTSRYSNHKLPGYDTGNCQPWKVPVRNAYCHEAVYKATYSLDVHKQFFRSCPTSGSSGRAFRNEK